MLGPLAYAVGGGVTAVAGRALRCAVDVDGRRVFQGRAWQVMVACSGAFGAGSVIDEAQPDDGLLDVVVIEAGNRLRLVQYANALRDGRITGQPGVLGARGAEVSLGLPGGAELNVDGEVIPAQTPITIAPGHFEVVVPLFSELMAQGAGDAIKGIYGTANWDWKLDNEGSKAFTKSFGQEYGQPPSQAAHTCYVQALLYANACETAGTFDPAGVVEALEGFEFDGLGNGPTLYRAEDHQCFKPVLVMRGAENPTNEFDLLEIVDVVPTEQVTYPPDHPMFAGGNLGTCNPGA